MARKEVVLTQEGLRKMEEELEVAAQRVILAMYYPADLVLDLWAGARKG